MIMIRRLMMLKVGVGGLVGGYPSSMRRPLSPKMTFLEANCSFNSCTAELTISLTVFLQKRIESKIEII